LLRPARSGVGHSTRCKTCMTPLPVTDEWQGIVTKQ
jgi:hypothetical protein